MTATMPAAHEDAAVGKPPELHDSDQDAEADDDVDTSLPGATAQDNSNNGDRMEVDEPEGAQTSERKTEDLKEEDLVPDEAEDGDTDAVEEGEEGEDQDEETSAAKRPIGEELSDEEEEDDNDDASFKSATSRRYANTKNKQSSSDEEESSEVDEEWEEEGTDVDAEDLTNNSNCMYVAPTTLTSKYQDTDSQYQCMRTGRRARSQRGL